MRSVRLDAVRGVAILFVLFHHYIGSIVGRYVPVFGKLSPMLWIGVDLFFVLSGFLLGGILLRNRGSESYFSAFYGRRFARILPLYALCVAIYFAHPLSAGDSLWPYLTFTQNIVWAFDGRGWGPPATAPMWSLALEEQFYLVLPLLIRACPPRALPKVLILLVASAPLTRAVFHAAGHPLAAYYMLPSRVDSLFLGVLIAWGMQQPTRPVFLRRAWLLLTLCVSGIFMGALLLADLALLDPVMSIAGISVVAVFFAACVALVAQTPPSSASMPTKMLALFGLGAYSIYLFHMPLLTMVNYARGQSWVHTVACMGAVCAVAWASWVLVERPGIRAGHSLFKYA